MQNKLIAAGFGLVGYGALLGWAITGDALEAKMKSNQRLLADIIDRKTVELEATKELLISESRVVYVPKPLDLSAEVPDVPVDDGVVRYDQVSGEVPKTDDELRGETPEQTKSNLQTIIDEYANNEDAQAFAEMASKVVGEEGVDNTPPFVISKAQYSWDDDEGDDYAKITVTYYPVDRVVVDEDEAFDNKEIEENFGWRNFEHFGGVSDDPNVVYIRNRRMLTDFEVVRDDENELPLHFRHGISRHEFDVRQAAGVTKFRRGDID